MLADGLLVSALHLTLVLAPLTILAAVLTTVKAVAAVVALFITVAAIMALLGFGGRGCAQRTGGEDGGDGDGESLVLHGVLLFDGSVDYPHPKVPPLSLI